MKKSFAASSAFCLNADSKTLPRIKRDGGALALISVQPWTNSKKLIDQSECALIFEVINFQSIKTLLLLDFREKPDALISRENSVSSS